MLLATNQVFIRGGVTIGDIYANGNTIFGPALIRAYELESKTAYWPIIAIDPDLIQAVHDEIPRYLSARQEKECPDGTFLGNMFLREFFSFIAKTNEEVPILDYIQCCAYGDPTTGDLSYWMEDHKKSVTSAHAKHRHYKYGFIAQYHDAMCERYFLTTKHCASASLFSGTPELAAKT